MNTPPPIDPTLVQVGGPTVSAATAHGFPAIAGYEILGKLGEGGMGVVYKAKHLKLDHIIALKLMLGNDPLNKARFLAEGQVMAAVKHPHVVEVYDFGESAIGPYIAMEYLPKGTFSSLLEAGLSPRVAAEQIAKIATGVGAAHNLNIVHRDLKPGNVLLDHLGSPKVTDFGLAKRSTSDMTMTQDAAGTPAYMAPEQARAMKFVGPSADVWSLGVMLYELLTGKRPFTADSHVQLLATIQNDNPPTLRTILKAIPQDLETICLKCLEKEPERRYTSANELASDLQAWHEGKPIAAKRAKAVERAMLWVRRKPTVAAAWTLALLVLMLGAFGLTTTKLWREAVEEKGIAEQSRDETEEQKKLADAARIRAETAEGIAKQAKEDIADERERLAYARNVYLAHASYLANDCGRADEFLALCPEKLRRWDWGYVHRLCHSDLHTLKLPGGYARAAAFSPNGGRIAIAGPKEVAGVWDVTTGKRDFSFATTDRVGVEKVAFSPDGAQVVSAGHYGDIRVWDAKTGEQRLRNATIQEAVLAVSFSPAGPRALTVFETHRTQLWDVEAGTVLQTLSHSTKLSRNTTTSGNVNSGAFSADGSRILTGALDHTARLWDAKTGKELQTLRGHPDAVKLVAISPDGNWAFTADRKTAQVWNAKTGASVATLKGATADLKSVAFSPDGSRIVTGGDNPHGTGGDQTVRVWDATTGAELFEFRGHNRGVYSVMYSADGTQIVSCGYDGTVKVWDATRAYEPRLPRTMDHSVAFSPDGRRLALYHRGSDLLLWNLVTGTKDLSIRTGTGMSIIEKARAVFSPDGTRVLTYGENVDVWDATTGASVFSLRKLDRRGRGVTSAAYTPDGTKVVTAAGFQFGDGTNFTASVWDVGTGAEVLTLRGHTKDVLGVAVSPDGSRIATSGNDLTVRVWDAATGDQLFQVQQPAALSLAFDATGGRLVAGGADYVVRVWDARTGNPGPILRGHTWNITATVFTPDGSRIVSGSWDRTAKVWDAQTGAEILTLVEKEAVGSVAVSPDGLRIAVAAYGLPRIYDATPVNREFLPKAAK